MVSSTGFANQLSLSLAEGSLADRVAALLASSGTASELAFPLEDLSLRIGIRLPEVAQTATFWQRGELGRRIRRLGFVVRVEYGRVIFDGEGAGRGSGG